MNQYTVVDSSKSNTWSVLRKADAFGYGYQAQDSQFDTEATAEGWEVLFTGMYPDLAVKFRDIYRTAGIPQVELTATPDLSDLLVWDFSEPQENRQSEFAQEFDLVAVEYKGRIIEGVVTFFDEDEIEIDGYLVMSVETFLKTATLIAKADEDSGFITEYNSYLTELDQNWNQLYAVANEAQNGMAA